MSVSQLESLEPGQQIVFGGDRVVRVSSQLAAAFVAGDRIIVDHDSGTILHVTNADYLLARDAVTAASAAFGELVTVSDDAISAFFDGFADRLADDDVFGQIAAANASDVESAQERGRSTTRLELTAAMRRDMIAGLRGWVTQPAARTGVERSIAHEAWQLEVRRAPLGVVGFVFEGRPNVFADAVGVLRTGNTVVFRIGSDALATARSIMSSAVQPALATNGIPRDAVVLIDSSRHAAGWALFDDSRLALAVARGSGSAVSQLGAVARQAGNSVSLHGTGGAWMIVDATADPDRLEGAVTASLDRKVCNTVNTICVVADAAERQLPVIVRAVRGAGGQRLHATRDAVEALARWVPELSAAPSTDRAAHGSGGERFVDQLDLSRLDVDQLDVDQLGREWEWETAPEVSLHVVADVACAVDLFNAYSPRFVISVLSADAGVHRQVYESADAPFVGDGMTRWVDGQYALNSPELGLSNWQHGRTFARGGILSGDSIFTVRYQARMRDGRLTR